MARLLRKVVVVSGLSPQYGGSITLFYDTTEEAYILLWELLKGYKPFNETFFPDWKELMEREYPDAGLSQQDWAALLLQAVKEAGEVEHHCKNDLACYVTLAQPYLNTQEKKNPPTETLKEVKEDVIREMMMLMDDGCISALTLYDVAKQVQTSGNSPDVTGIQIALQALQKDAIEVMLNLLQENKHNPVAFKNCAEIELRKLRDLAEVQQWCNNQEENDD